MKKTLLNLLPVIVLFFSGCGGYHLGSIPPAGVKSIYIPMFENTTIRQEITSDATNAVIKRFNTDGTIKVTNKESADAILQCKITAYTTESVLFNDQDIGEEFRVMVNTDITLTSTETGEILFVGKNIDGESVTQITINQTEAEKRVFPVIVQDLAKNIVEAVLESAW